MGLDAFSGVFTCQQIVEMARRRVGSPDLHLTSSGSVPASAADVQATPAYQELQVLLDHLAMAYDWPFARVALNINITGRTQALPTAYWRPSFSDPLFLIDQDGGRSQLQLTGEDIFYANLTTHSQGRPERFCIHKIGQDDSVSGILVVDPAPDKTYLAEIHYQPWQAAITAITDKPWFPWSEYLVSALATKLALYQDDRRGSMEAQLAAKLMREIRHSISDQGQRSATLRLNPQIYRTPLNLN